jgi:hypothetical protein
LGLRAVGRQQVVGRHRNANTPLLALSHQPSGRTGHSKHLESRRCQYHLLQQGQPLVASRHRRVARYHLLQTLVASRHHRVARCHLLQTLVASRHHRVVRCHLLQALLASRHDRVARCHLLQTLVASRQHHAGRQPEATRWDHEAPRRHLTHVERWDQAEESVNGLEANLTTSQSYPPPRLAVQRDDEELMAGGELAAGSLMSDCSPTTAPTSLLLSLVTTSFFILPSPPL